MRQGEIFDSIDSSSSVNANHVPAWSSHGFGGKFLEDGPAVPVAEAVCADWHPAISCKLFGEVDAVMRMMQSPPWVALTHSGYAPWSGWTTGTPPQALREWISLLARDNGRDGEDIDLPEEVQLVGAFQCAQELDAIFEAVIL
jgi:hypothetical protein